jgi:hypothetical protein
VQHLLGQHLHREAKVTKGCYNKSEITTLCVLLLMAIQLWSAFLASTCGTHRGKIASIMVVKQQITTSNNTVFAPAESEERLI